MALYSWPSDPKGKRPSHTIPYSAKGTAPSLKGVQVGGKPATYQQWKTGQLTPRIKGAQIGNKPVNTAQWASGEYLRHLLGGKPLPPGAGPGAPAAPAPAAPGPAPLPPDAAYDAARAAADLQYQTTVAGLAGGRARGLSDYGFTEDATTHALTLDPNNPFSKAALLKQNYDRTRRSSAQSMGASGQLYSGAFQNQQDYVNRGELGAQDTLQKSLGEFLARNTTDVGQAGVTRQTAYSTAEEGRQGRIDTNPLYDPAATVATPAAAANTRGAIITNKRGNRGRWVTRPDGTRYFQVV